MEDCRLLACFGQPFVGMRICQLATLVDAVRDIDRPDATTSLAELHGGSLAEGTKVSRIDCWLDHTSSTPDPRRTRNRQTSSFGPILRFVAERG